jgi:hypothetical protein
MELRHDLGGQALHLLALIEQGCKRISSAPASATLRTLSTQASGGPQAATSSRPLSPK